MAGAFLRAGLLLLAATLAGLSHAARHSVSPGESIAAAIRAAQAGDVIQVERGHYEERLLIDKPLALVGVDRPTLSAQGEGDVIRVRAADVRIEGFIVRDSGADLGEQNAGIYVEPGADRLIVRGNHLVYNLFGIWLNGVKDVQLAGNVITGKRDLSSAQRGNGIQLYNTTGAQVIGNNISFTRDGIYVDISHHAVFRDNRLHHSRYGAHYMNSNDNVWEDNVSYLNRGGIALMQVRNQVVRGNRAWGNTDHGIMLRSIQDSVVENNVVSGNNRGLFVYDAEYNVLKGNLVAANRVGVHLWAGSIHNQVEGNDFINNQEQVRFVATRDEEWGRQTGNYWSNYRGWDTAGDGVGDVPYEANDLVDRLTWKHPLVKLLLNSPAVHSLRLLARQFPMLRSPSVVDKHPRMRPFHDDWNLSFDEQRH
ncbi:nitrous oxide reductase family maturation protein NosD [Ramlibacter tataouinensis]|uniref:nitrous oxide reductase family maturation protein NosD n=1 Tax=Ramlibacter tataouinensis TaxID=94132 RepID=UPI0039EE14FD